MFMWAIVWTDWLIGSHDMTCHSYYGDKRQVFCQGLYECRVNQDQEWVGANPVWIESKFKVNQVCNQSAFRDKLGQRLCDWLIDWLNDYSQKTNTYIIGF